MLWMKATAALLPWTAVRGTRAHMKSALSSVAEEFVPAKPPVGKDSPG